ncbi:MAG: S9 family peptidase, partial [Gammaproteobacteria bacterium]|nr:S9 family peptidase [Gammaproteobacteria bacterium]
MTARRHFRTAPAFLALVIAFAPPVQSAAQQPSGLLDMDTYMEMESVGSPRISPDGNYILFTRGSVDKMNDRNKSELMIMDLSTRRISELETGSFEVSSPIWSPDGTRIAFLSDKSGTNQIHVMWLDTRETKQLTNLDRAPGGIRWSPDGGHISFTSFIPETGSPLPITMPAFPPGANLAKPAVVEDRIAWQRDGTGYTRRGNTQIFIVDADLGGTPRQITFGDTSHGNPRWAPDGTKLYFSGDLIPEEGYERGNSEVHAIDLATLEITTLTDRLGPDNGPIPSPDGRMIAYTGYDENENYSNLSHLYLMDADGSGSRMLAGNLKNSPSGVTWAPDGSGLYYTLGEEGSSNLHFVSTSGDIEKVTDGVHYISGVSIANNGRAAAINSTFYRPNYLITFDLDDADELETLVDYNEDVLAGITLGDVEEIWTESVDGWPVQGWLMKPANFDPGREYPLLLWIHGGPVSMYTVRWNWNWQNFAADGY